MSFIEKSITPFIENQFPSFYKEEGPNFIAFVKAYYEWLEQENNAINHTRRLMETYDIDLTREQFIKHFKNTYINSIPANILTDERLLIKHCLDLYRSKGSSRAVELLFRILFNEDIQVFVPGDFLLRSSDGLWKRSEYIEITSHPRFGELPRKTITNSEGSASAIVESAFSKVIDGKTVNILYLSSVRGTFKYGQRIICEGIISLDDSPIIVGSLTAIPVENGGFGFNVGDILDINGSGIDGKARVAAVRNEDGKVRFEIIDGGSGYSLNAVVTVAKTLNLVINSVNGFFTNAASVVDTSTNANGTLVSANSTNLVLINFSSNLQFQTGSTVTDGTATAVVTDVLGGGGAGASFKVGALVNKEIYLINSDIIADYLSTTLETQLQITTGVQTGVFSPGHQITSVANSLLMQATYLSPNTVIVGERLSNASLGISNLYCWSSDQRLLRVTGLESQLDNANLITGAVLSSNITSSVLQLDFNPMKETISTNAVVFFSNSTSITCNVTTGSAEFIPTSNIVNLSAPANTTVISQTRLTDWFFPARITAALRSNLDSRIDETLVIYSLEVGTISELTDINPGSGYSSPPYVDVIQPDVALLGEDDGGGNVKGHNAIISGKVSNERGVVTAVEVYDSGIGYLPNETVFLSNDQNDVSVRGVAVVTSDGRGAGAYNGSRGFLSDQYKLQDGDYYQIYSYEIISTKMKDTYDKLVYDLIHPAGYKLFGRFKKETKFLLDTIELKSSSITQSNTP